MVTIYRVFNSNGLSYIGSTTRPIKKRFAEHRCHGKKTNNTLHEIFKDEAVTIEALDYCNLKNRFDRERCWLNKYPNSVNKCTPWQGPKDFKPAEEQRARSAVLMKKRWTKNRPELLKYVNAHKTIKFQKMASAAGHKKKYEIMPIKEVVCAHTRKRLGTFKTQQELCSILGLSRKTIYRFTHGMGIYKDKFIISEVSP